MDAAVHRHIAQRQRIIAMFFFFSWGIRLDAYFTPTSLFKPSTLATKKEYCFIFVFCSPHVKWRSPSQSVTMGRLYFAFLFHLVRYSIYVCTKGRYEMSQQLDGVCVCVICGAHYETGLILHDRTLTNQIATMAAISSSLNAVQQQQQLNKWTQREWSWRESARIPREYTISTKLKPAITW